MPSYTSKGLPKPLSTENVTRQSHNELVDAIDAALVEILEDSRLESTKAFKVEVRTSDPLSPEVGRMWLRSDL